MPLNKGVKDIRTEYIRENKDIDVVVVGGGHAGCEAAHACAKLGLRTLLATLSVERIGLTPCNPAMGGPGKGHLIREVDALGGLIGRATDEVAIQMRMLNRSRGIAVRALRAQIDKRLYNLRLRDYMLKNPDIILFEGEVAGIIVKNRKVRGVIFKDGSQIECNAVIVATGTFLNGRLVIGDREWKGGRAGEAGAYSLSDSLKEIGIKVMRFQTATPPRVHKRSIDFSKLKPEPGDAHELRFSHFSYLSRLYEIPSYLAFTNEKTQTEVRKHLHLSPLRIGNIQTHGPRHCPSIDRKVINFPEKVKHPVFVEPEGSETEEMYLQGLTTAMPYEAQLKVIRTIEGLENAEIVRPGYAVEYDFIDPTQLKHSLESREIDGLFFCGQINGTSGYEEAAAQGIVAGINAALKVKGKEPFILSREESYIGVMIDDLVTRGVEEPYRVYTSRAENRLLLRFDNADIRLTPKAREIGMITDEEWEIFLRKKEMVERLVDEINKSKLVPEIFNRFASENNLPEIQENTPLSAYLKRPEVSTKDLFALLSITEEFQDISQSELMEIITFVDAELKYEGYTKRQKKLAETLYRLEKMSIPESIDFEKIPGISYRAKSILSMYRPKTIGEASKLPNIAFSDLVSLAGYLEVNRIKDKEAV